MPKVTIHPGGTYELLDDGTSRWTFQATVDGRVGIVEIWLPGEPTYEQAERAAKGLLEEDPDQLEGIG